MHFVTIREFSKAPKASLSKLAQDGKAVLTNNGKPAALLLHVNAENFEQVFTVVQEAEKNMPHIRVLTPGSSEQEREEAFETLMQFPRRIPADFDCKQELREARDERFGVVT